MKVIMESSTFAVLMLGLTGDSILKSQFDWLTVQYCVVLDGNTEIHEVV